jgi:hypothetical protein
MARKPSRRTPAPAPEAQENRIAHPRDPGAQSATAPRPTVAPGASVHGAQAKPAHAGAGA